MLLAREDVALVVVDIQERLLPVIANGEQVVRNSGVLIRGARVLQVPILVTEQYPKGLGATVGALDACLESAPRIEKLTFSCAGEPAFMRALEELGVSGVILCGIESHVCVLQTALELRGRGLGVHVAADAVGSRAPANHEIALARMRQAGVVVTCVESILFQLLREAGTPQFKEVARLVK